jgi:hypothetical protein
MSLYESLYINSKARLSFLSRTNVKDGNGLIGMIFLSLSS